MLRTGEQAEMLRNLSDCAGFQDNNNHFQGLIAMWAVLDVNNERPFEQTGPTHVPTDRGKRHIAIHIGCMIFVLLAAMDILVRNIASGARKRNFRLRLCASGPCRITTGKAI